MLYCCNVATAVEYETIEMYRNHASRFKIILYKKDVGKMLITSFKG